MNGNREKDRDSNVWCKTDGEKEDRGPNGVRWNGYVLRRDTMMGMF